MRLHVLYIAPFYTHARTHKQRQGQIQYKLRDVKYFRAHTHTTNDKSVKDVRFKRFPLQCYVPW